MLWGPDRRSICKKGRFLPPGSTQSLCCSLGSEAVASVKLPSCRPRSEEHMCNGATGYLFCLLRRTRTKRVIFSWSMSVALSNKDIRQAEIRVCCCCCRKRRWSPVASSGCGRWAALSSPACTQTACFSVAVSSFVQMSPLSVCFCHARCQQAAVIRMAAPGSAENPQRCQEISELAKI